MEIEQLINIISGSDTGSAELLFDKPGGRKYFESIILVVMTGLPCAGEEKAELFTALISVFDKIEKRIKRQKEGRKILQSVFS